MAEIVAIKRSTPEGPVWSSLENGVLRLVLANPPANALSIDTMAALQAQLDGAREDSDVRVIVLAASGSVFCAGHDLKEVTAHRSDADRGRAFFELTMSRCSALMQSIVRHPKPVIAEVDGLATAAGLQLVASCDLAIASDQSTFCTPGVNIGLFCSTPMVALTRNVPAKRAMEMLLLGELIDAERAADWGLVNRVVENGRARDGALSFARQIAAKSPLTVAVGKRAFYDQLSLSRGDAYELTARVMVENLLARDAAEGISAFIEKRTPEWKGC